MCIITNVFVQQQFLEVRTVKWQISKASIGLSQNSGLDFVAWFCPAVPRVVSCTAATPIAPAQTSVRRLSWTVWTVLVPFLFPMMGQRNTNPGLAYCVGQAEGCLILCYLSEMQSLQKKTWRRQFGFQSVIPHACCHNASSPQEYSGLCKYYEVCGFKGFLMFWVSIPLRSHSSEGVCVRLNGSSMGCGTGESQTRSSSSHHPF